MTSQILVEKKKIEKPPLKIHELGDKILRYDAKRVSKVDNEIRQLAQQMLQTMYSFDGIGLAAPQVGIPKQLIVIDIHPDQEKTPPLILINPVIKKYSTDLSVYEEGCLSIPKVFFELKRPKEIEVTYKDENGRPKTIIAKELLARVIQHEIDHLTGVMFVDRIDNSLTLTKELTKNGFSMKSVQPIGSYK